MIKRKHGAALLFSYGAERHSTIRRKHGAATAPDAAVAW
jgi:hypothetical protein